MGLDQYLTKYPRIGELTQAEIFSAESYVDYEEYMAKAENKDKCTFKEWNRFAYENLPSTEDINLVRNHMKTTYFAWDNEHKYPHMTCTEEIGYWRKANAIHDWFVKNVWNDTDGEKNREVTKSDLQTLRRTCKKVLDSLNLQNGTVTNGYTIGKNGECQPILEDGMTATNTELAKELLPTCSGFFFGSTDYDQWYAEDLKNTIDIIDKALAETDFNNEMIYYSASW